MTKEKRNKRKLEDDENGFAKWGGYMKAKISKLEVQFEKDVSEVKKIEKISDIFKGISIFVNGYTEPSADELRDLMIQHGGTYHHYFRSEKTTHIIASVLPNAKFDQLKTLKVVKCEWITESIKFGKLLDYKKFLLVNDFCSVTNSGKFIKVSKEKVSEGNKKENEAPKTAADDGYIAEFYKNSRLHYISSLGAMLKQHVQEMRDCHNGFFPGKQELLENFSEDALDPDYFINGTTVMHIDMDCFFVSVALRNRPELKGQPVAVTHSKGNSNRYRENVDRKFEYEFYKKKIASKVHEKGKESGENEDAVEEWSNEKCSMSEIASCSYEARRAGVSNGMYLGSALKLCPNLKTVSYDFEGYREVSLCLYNTVAEYTVDIEAISCDELIIDCTKLLLELKISPLKLAEILRKKILEKTGCTSSVGLGSNKLLARLATKYAKPNGQFHLTSSQVNDFMKKLKVNDLPGVGRTLSAKLKSLNINTCEDLQKFSLSSLKKEFGVKTGEALHKHCRGEDDKKVNFSHERKSVSAELNYGIRFNDDEETEIFLKQLSQEVAKRLKNLKMVGGNITFKVMFRAKNAPIETAKFLGHGACDHVARSVALPVASDDAIVIARCVINMYHKLGIPPNELRGIGIQVNKLKSAKKVKNNLQNYFEHPNRITSIKPTSSATPTLSVEKNIGRGDMVLPTVSQIDTEVLVSLPENIRLEVLKEYGSLINESFSNNRVNQNLGNSTELSLQNLQEDNRDIWEQNLQQIKEKQKQENEEENKFFRLTAIEMKTLINEWVMAEHWPKSSDVTMLKIYLREFIERKKLESFHTLLKRLRRLIITWQKNSFWKTIFNEIVNDVQQSMIAVFGKALAIDYID